MEYKLMYYAFPRDQIQLDGTTAELPQKIAAAVQDTTDALIVRAVLAAAKAEEVTDLYLLDKKFIMEAILEKRERENPRILTHKELNKLNECPIYVVPKGPYKDQPPHWCVKFGVIVLVPGYEWTWSVHDYGKTWIAYRNKPKEE